MKYCRNCGSPMNDEDLFCSKCGTRVSEPIEESNNQEVYEEPIFEEEIKEEVVTPDTKKGTPIYEQKVKEFLPVPCALIGCSIILWIINSVGNTSGITRIMPLLIFMALSGFLGALSMIRAVKSFNRKMFFKAALSFVLFRTPTGIILTQRPPVLRRRRNKLKKSSSVFLVPPLIWFNDFATVLGSRLPLKGGFARTREYISLSS